MTLTPVSVVKDDEMHLKTKSSQCKCPLEVSSNSGSYMKQRQIDRYREPHLKDDVMSS